MVSIPASEKLYSDGSQREVTMNPSSSQSNLKCYLCNGNHKLEVCDKFKRKNGEEQFKFVCSKNCVTPVCPLSILQLDVSEVRPVAFLVVISSGST